MVAGHELVMAEMAADEFQAIVAVIGGPKEQARARRLLTRVRIVPDNPSARAQRLKPTRSLHQADIVILGTGDDLGAVTATSDARAVRAASAQGVDFGVYLHPSAPLTGN